MIYQACRLAQFRSPDNGLILGSVRSRLCVQTNMQHLPSLLACLCRDGKLHTQDMRHFSHMLAGLEGEQCMSTVAWQGT